MTKIKRFSRIVTSSIAGVLITSTITTSSVFAQTVAMSTTVSPPITSVSSVKYIKSIENLNVEVKQNDKYALPVTIEAVMSDGTKEKVAVTWNSTKVDTSKAGKVTYTGKVNNFSKNVTLTLNVKKGMLYVIGQHITVYVGEKYTLPSTLEAVMTDESSLQVPVTWNTTKIDTSKPGTQTFKGTVKDYKGQVELVLQVQYKVRSVQAVDEKKIAVIFEGPVTDKTMPEIWSSGENGAAGFNPFCELNKSNPNEVDVKVNNFYAPCSYTLMIGKEVYTVKATKTSSNPTKVTSAAILSDNIIEVSFDKNIDYVTRPYVQLFDENNKLIPYYHSNESNYIYTKIDYNKPTKLYVILKNPTLFKPNKYTLKIGDKSFSLQGTVDKGAKLGVTSIKAEDEKSISIKFNKSLPTGYAQKVKVYDKTNKEVTDARIYSSYIMPNEIDIKLNKNLYKNDVVTVIVDGKKYIVAGSVDKADIPQIKSIEVKGSKQILIHFNKNIDQQFLYYKFDMHLYDKNKNEIFNHTVVNTYSSDTASFKLDTPLVKPDVYTLVSDGVEYKINAIVDAKDLPEIKSVEVTKDNKILVHYDKNLSWDDAPSTIRFDTYNIYGYSTTISNSDYIISNLSGKITKGMRFNLIIEGNTYPITLN